MWVSGHDYTLLVTDRHLTVQGDPLPGWTQVEALRRFREVGTGSVSCPAVPEVMAQLEPSHRIVLIRDGEVFSGGPVEDVEDRWSADGADSQPGMVTVTWAEDTTHLAGRVVYPNPAQAASAQTAARRSFTATNAETVLRTLVNESAGPSALTARRVPRLILGDVAGVGTTITYATRFIPLTDVLREVATLGGELGYDITQVGDDLLFAVYAPADLTRQVRFSPSWGNLRRFGFNRSAPRTTTAIVGGLDEGESREIRERTNTTDETEWWRVETFLDRRGDDDDPTELDDTGDAYLADNGQRVRLEMVTVDTPQQAYGETYRLGDRVSVALRDVAEVSDVVRAVHLQVAPDRGEVITSMVGTQDAATGPDWIRESRRIARELARRGTAGEVPT